MAPSKPGPQSDIKAMAGAVCKLISNWAMWETHKMIYFQAAAAKCCCTSYWIMLSFSQHCMLVVFFVAVQRAAWNLIKRHKFDWMWICVRQMCRHSLFSDEKYQSHLFPLSFEPPASSAAAADAVSLYSPIEEHHKHWAGIRMPQSVGVKWTLSHSHCNKSQFDNFIWYMRWGGDIHMFLQYIICILECSVYILVYNSC